MGGGIRCWRNTWSFFGQKPAFQHKSECTFYWKLKRRSSVNNSISCLNRALDSHLLPKYRLACVRALICLKGFGEAHLGHPLTTLICTFSSPISAQLWAPSCPLSQVIGVPEPPICCSGLLTGFLGWTPGLPCKEAFFPALCSEWSSDPCHRSISNLLSWLGFLGGSYTWLFVSPCLWLSIDTITTTSLVLFRQCEALGLSPSPRLFFPWRSTGLAAPWWVVFF